MTGWTLVARPTALAVLDPAGVTRAQVHGLAGRRRPRGHQVMDVHLPDGRRTTLTNGSDWRRRSDPRSRGRLRLGDVDYVLEHEDQRSATVLRAGRGLATLRSGWPVAAAALRQPLTGEDDLAVALFGLVLKPGRSGVLDAVGEFFRSLG